MQTGIGASSIPNRPQITKPLWLGYVIVIVVEFLLTGLLIALHPAFPPGTFRIPYALIVVAAAYIFGTGPAWLTFFLSLVGYILYLQYPAWPWTQGIPSEDIVQLGAYIASLLAAIFVGLVFKQSKEQAMILAESIRDSSQQVTSILENITDAFMAFNNKGEFTYVNGEAERSLRKSREDLIGKNIWEAFPEAVSSRLYDGYHRAITEQSVVTEEEYLPLYDVWLEVRYYPSANGVSAFFRDITTRKKSEEDLEKARDEARGAAAREVEARSTLEAILEAAPVGVVVAEAKTFSISYISPHTISMFGEEIIDKAEGLLGEQSVLMYPDGSIIESDDRPLVRSIRYGETVENMEVMFTRSDGGHVTVLVNSAPVRDDRDRITVAVATFTDITEIVELRNQLERALEREKGVSTTLQRALAPPEPSISGGFRVASEYDPAYRGEEIGGDFYDVFRTSAGKIAILIGDVSGKGIEAAAMAAATRSTIRVLAYETSSVSETLTRANAVLYEQQTDDNSFVTAFLVIMDTESGRFFYSSAGHPPAAVYRSGGAVEFLSISYPPVGILPKQVYQQNEDELTPGDFIALYTDGIMEARRGMEMFGLEGIQKTLEEAGGMPADEIVYKLTNAAKDWVRGRLNDDVAVVVVERRADMADLP